jgi:hypothetical protein
MEYHLSKLTQKKKKTRSMQTAFDDDRFSNKEWRRRRGKKYAVPNKEEFVDTDLSLSSIPST